MKKIGSLILGGILAFCFGLTVNADSGSQNMYRMYNSNSGEHFYTASINERTQLLNAGWDYEGVGWIAPAKSNVPVYRLYNPNAGDHHYTIDKNEMNHLRSVGWRYEGIGWYSSDQKKVPLYRLYNPNAVAGSHHYTLVTAERSNLIGKGWRNEGISWYALAVPKAGEGLLSEKKVTNMHVRISKAGMPIYASPYLNGVAVTGSSNNYYQLVAMVKFVATTAYGTFYQIAFPDNAVGWINAAAVTNCPDYWMYNTGGNHPSLNQPNLNIEVAYNAKRVYVKSGSKVIYTMLCNHAMPGWTALVGNYTTGIRGLSFGGSLGGARYYLQIWGDYLFHTIPTDGNGNYIASLGERLGVLGNGVSHGCVHLSVADAYWFYTQMPSGVPINLHW